MSQVELFIVAGGPGDGTGTTGCSGGTCPTLYRASDGRYFVQGTLAGSEIVAAAQVPAGEGLVEIPRSLVEEIARARVTQ